MITSYTKMNKNLWHLLLLLVILLFTSILIVVVLLQINNREVVYCQWENLNVIKLSGNNYVTKDEEGNIWHKFCIQIGRDKNCELSFFVDFIKIRDFDGSCEPYFYYVQNMRPKRDFYCANICKNSDFEILDEFISNKSAPLAICLVSMDITDDIVSYLNSYENIVELKFYSCNLNSSTKFKHDSLSYLKFVSMELNDNLTAFFNSKIFHLEVVDCTMNQKTVITLSAFEKIKRLKYESISPKLLPNDIMLLNKMQNLKYLELNSALDDSVSAYDFTSNKSIETLTITIKQTGDGKIPDIKVNPNCNLELKREVAPN